MQVDPAPHQTCPSSVVLDSVNFSAEDVGTILSALDTNSSMGPDGLHPHLLRSCSEALAYPLYTIFCKSLAEGSLPAEWKTFIFEATTSISWLQNYASQLQPDYENAPQTSRIEDGSGRLVGAYPTSAAFGPRWNAGKDAKSINRPVGHRSRAADPILHQGDAWPLKLPGRDTITRRPTRFYRPIFQTADPI